METSAQTARGDYVSSSHNCFMSKTLLNDHFGEREGEEDKGGWTIRRKEESFVVCFGISTLI